jgi:hypothetical protein
MSRKEQKKDKNGDKIVMVQMPKEMWQHLKWLSFKMNVSMAELCRRGADHVLKEGMKKFGPPA